MWKEGYYECVNLGLSFCSVFSYIDSIVGISVGFVLWLFHKAYSCLERLDVTSHHGAASIISTCRSNVSLSQVVKYKQLI